MNLKVLGSGSSGNCYILESDTEALIIEAGLPFREVKKALNFNVRKIKAVFITHEHGDHRKFWYEYVKAGIPVFEPYRNDGYTFEFENSQFTVQAFENRSKDGKWLHGNSDGTECPCFGYYIQHPDIGSLVYATDTEYIRWRFNKVNHILVEANYSEDLIDSEAINRNHVLRGHMSLKTALDFISANDSPELQNVVLLHLSRENADGEIFRHQAERTMDKKVYMAKKGLEVDLNLCPF